MKIAIIGAGIIGTTMAHAALDEGHEVELIDREGIAAGTSQGNAGWIAHIDILPLASPKVWRQLPRWMVDPLGPLAIRPAYLPWLAPWLARFVMASMPAALEHNTRAFISLQLASLPAWKRRAEPIQLSHHLRESGCLSVWSDRGTFEAAQPVIRRQQAVGIPITVLTPAELRAMEPAFGDAVVGAAHFPSGCRVSDPRVLTKAVGEAALKRGATLTLADVAAIAPRQDGVAIRTADGREIVADRVVLAAGAWSKALAKSLGDRVPLDTERGYNITAPSGTLGLTLPVNYEGHGFITTPLDTGDRIGGAVEFGGFTAKPNYARVDAMIRRLRLFLPHLGEVTGTRWMGFRPSIPDSLPVIGPSSADARVIYAFGHGHYGLTEAAITAEMVAALIGGRKPPVDVAPFSAKRFG